MKHTEGKLERAGLKLKHENGPIMAEMNPVGTAYGSHLKQQEINAQRLVTCWNEHDTLTAKAALFDELVRVYEKPYCTSNIMQLLSKAKDLK